MKKNILKVLIVIISLSLFVSFYIKNQNSLDEEGTIDLVGNNKFFKSSLNIHLNYNSELIIRPRRDDFDIPSQINIEITSKGNSLYTNTLEYIPDENYLLGKYMVVLDSNDYFKKDIDNVQIKIDYDNESSSILLK